MIHTYYHVINRKILVDRWIERQSLNGIYMTHQYDPNFTIIIIIIIILIITIDHLCTIICSCKWILN